MVVNSGGGGSTGCSSSSSNTVISTSAVVVHLHTSILNKSTSCVINTLPVESHCLQFLTELLWRKPAGTEAF